MRIEYVGPFGEVELPAVGLTLTHGQPVEVPDSDAKPLLEQSDNFRRAGAIKADKADK